MGLRLDNLDDTTRRLMVDELERDGEGAYVSPRLSPAGRSDWKALLREAIEQGDEETLANALRVGGRLNATEQARTPKGGVTTKRVGVNAPDTLAEGEFNRYYIRAVCRRALDEGVAEVEVYRAKAVSRPRPESEALIGQRRPAQALLDDLRAHPGEETQYGVPGGPNSGLSIRLPA